MLHISKAFLRQLVIGQGERNITHATEPRTLQVLLKVEFRGEKVEVAGL